MLFLGVSANYHDAAACLVEDGQIVACAHEERSSRVKHDASFPRGAIATCLDETGRTLDDLDGGAFYEDPLSKMERAFLAPFAFFPHGRKGFGAAMARQLKKNVFVLDALRAHTGLQREKVRAYSHHQTHAASAYFPSGFDDAAVLVVDGVGEEWTTSLWHGADNTLTFQEGVAHPHSLGLFYAAITAFLGFRVNSGEYKVMGLAAFGKPRFQSEMQRLVKLRPDGSFVLDGPAFRHGVDPERAFGESLTALLGPARPYGLPWHLSTDADRRYADIAASAQAHLETACVALARRAKSATQSTRLCLAGGVALNVRAVRRIVDAGIFDEVFVQPAAGDAGGAVGAALLLAADHHEPACAPLVHGAWGKRLDAARGYDVARALGLSPERVTDPAQKIADAIARGRTVALCTGRSEFGPRALGQRSLLANPDTVQTREWLNRRIKKREPFRPFAPAVKADAFDTYFDGACAKLQPFMTVTNGVTEAGRAFGATTHVDGTSRAQAVRTPGILLDALSALERGGRAPCVVNTSLNGAGEPICDTAEDALALFLRAPIDDLFLDDIHIVRAGANASAENDSEAQDTE